MPMRHLTVTGTRTRARMAATAARHQLRLRHQAGAEAALLHAVRRAADVEVDLVVAIALADRRRLRQPAGSEPPSCSATGCSSALKPSSRSRWPCSTASAVTISVYSRACPDNSRWKNRQCRSVQSIMGATQNLCGEAVIGQLPTRPAAIVKWSGRNVQETRKQRRANQCCARAENRITPSAHACLRKRGTDGAVPGGVE